jgi:hypothetical protein
VPEDGKPLSEWDEFVVASIPPIVVAMQELPNQPLQPVFPSNLTALIEQRFDGNSAAITRILRVTRRTVTDWAAGKLRPSISSLLMLEYCFGAKAMDWITGRICISDLHTPRSLDKAAAVKIYPVPKQYAPAVLRDELAKALESDEFPPRSLHAVCRQLGFCQTIANRNCPELAQQILSRFKMFRTVRKQIRETFQLLLIQSAVNQLLHEGRALSFHQLAKILPRQISVRDKRVLIEFVRLKKEAEEEMQLVMREHPRACP